MSEIITGVPDVVEQDLGREVSDIEQKAMNVVIATEDDYRFAGEITKSVKQMQKKVTEYWEPMRSSAKKAYDDILSHKKEMLDPLVSAEKILKGKISDYIIESERKKKEAEEAMKKIALQEANKKLEEAVELEKNGDAFAAEYALAEAEVYEEAASLGVSAQAQKLKAKGVSYSTTWEITEIDEQLVPVDINGMVLRPVDQSAIKALIKASNGRISIPGVKYKEKKSVSISSK